jgi:single-stranded DNA-specific DHH superfamily exonuclease
LKRAKRENLHALQRSAELQNTDLTFQPRICRCALSTTPEASFLSGRSCHCLLSSIPCSNSDRIARSRRRQEGKEVDEEEDDNVGVRLLRESKRFEEQRRRKLREISEEVRPSCAQKVHRKLKIRSQKVALRARAHGALGYVW